jgi:peptidoglycan hydrolase-like protein with peptidoglycan-binding domain
MAYAPFSHLLKSAPVPGANAPAKPNPAIARAQARLAAHGFHPGSTNGHLDIPTRRAVANFQAANGIPPTPSGTIDSATHTALERMSPGKPGTRVAGQARGITARRAPGDAGAGPVLPGIVHSTGARIGHAVSARVQPGAPPPHLAAPATRLSFEGGTIVRNPATGTATVHALPRPAHVATPPHTFGAGHPAPTSTRVLGQARTATNRAAGGQSPSAPSLAVSPHQFQRLSDTGGSTMSGSGGQKNPGLWKATGLRVPLIMAAAVAAGATVLITQLPQMDFRGENVVIDPTIIGPNCLVTVPTVGTNPQVAGGPAGTGIPGTMFSPNQCGALDFAMQISNQGNALSMSVTNTLTNATLNFAALIFGHEVGPDTTAMAAVGGVAAAGSYLG